MNRLLLILLCISIQGCSQKAWYGDLNYLGTFPANLSEVSGIVSYDGNTAWVIEDKGNTDFIYKINGKAQIIKKLNVKNGKNTDWEDLTKDKLGNLYIGNFGNNANERKDLVIYKLPNPELAKDREIRAEKIKFTYPEQKKFPPKKDRRFFDAEGFFHWNKNLYIFTKDRSRPYQGTTFVYQVPDSKGTYEAKLVGKLDICKNQDHCSITSATISNDGKKMVLMGYGFLYVSSSFDITNISNVSLQPIDLNYATQMESVTFIGKDTLLIADEQSKTKGKNLYSFVLK